MGLRAAGRRQLHPGGDRTADRAGNRPGRQAARGNPDGAQPRGGHRLHARIRPGDRRGRHHGPEPFRPADRPGEEGRLRSRACPIPGSAYSPPAEPRTVADAFLRLLATAAAIADPFEQSFFLLVHLSYLRPFSAGDTALARLAADIPLLRRNAAPIAYRGIPAALFSEAVLAVCERNDVALLRDLFLAAGELSRAADPPAPPLPDPFRLQYRTEIKAAVREVVLAGEAAAEAERRIRAHGQARLPREARARFLAAVEAELASLHDGNFARYQLRPSEFAAWKPRMRRR